MQDIFASDVPIGAMGFVGEGYDRADALRRDEHKLAALLVDSRSQFLVLQDLKPVLDVSGLAPRPLWLGRDALPPFSDWIMLGFDGEIARFAVTINAAHPLPGKALDTRSAAMQMSPEASAIIGQARAMLAWHASHPFCAKCGTATRSTKGGYQRTCTHQACRAEHFPRTDPVAIMLVVDGDTCLLGRQPGFPPGFYSALAGFLEPGETLEACVRREVQEESGIKIGRVRYVASQPWPFPSSLMMGCLAEAVSHDIHIDSHELEDARWFTRSEAIASLNGNGPFLCPPPVAIAHHLLKLWATL